MSPSYSPVGKSMGYFLNEHLILDDSGFCEKGYPSEGGLEIHENANQMNHGG